jgi:hypothetical protein
MIVSVQIISEINADDLQARHPVGGNRAQGFAECVKRAGADIAIDNADRTKGRDRKLPLFPCRANRV